MRAIVSIARIGGLVAIVVSTACTTSTPTGDVAVPPTTAVVTDTTGTTATPGPPASTATTTPASTTTTTTTMAPPPAPLPLQRGDGGEQVALLQRRLVELGYWLPEVDGRFGALTQQAVLAFQKVEGFERDGVVGDLTVLALDAAERPSPRLPEVDGIEIDLERQVMFVVRGGVVVEVHNTSTGRSGWRTRPGSFVVKRQIDGMRHAPLGDMWRPKYFDGGIAMHGSTSIPAYPASHGCTRLSYPAIDHIWDDDLAPLGSPVTVY